MLQEPRIVELQLYKRNTIYHRSKGYVCKKVHTKIETYTDLFWRNKYRTVVDTNLLMTQEECQMMIHESKCTEGKLVYKGTGVWMTENSPGDYYYPTHPGAYYTREFNINNCVLEETSVMKLHTNDFMECPDAPATTCIYQSGNCKLKNNWFVKWEPIFEERCQFTEWRNITGKLYGNAWISDDATLALSYKTPEEIIDCYGKKVFLSDQK